MASTISGLEAYDGIIADVKLPVIFEITGIPLVEDGAFIAHRFGVAGPTERQNFVTQRALLIEKIIELKDNAQVETQILRLLEEWLALPAAGVIKAGKDGGAEMAVDDARHSIKLRLFAYYGIVPADSGGGGRNSMELSR